MDVENCTPFSSQYGNASAVTSVPAISPAARILSTVKPTLSMTASGRGWPNGIPSLENDLGYAFEQTGEARIAVFLGDSGAAQVLRIQLQQ